MSRPMRLLVLVLIATPAITYLIYRLARGLGFLDPPATKEQEHRRTIMVALYAFLVFLPTLVYGYEKGWPRVWAIFGVVNALALTFFAALGTLSAVKLWRLRHGEGSREAPSSPARSDSLLPDVDLQPRGRERSTDESLL
ncbi:MAG: hypothetical protein ABR576_03835 [Thermoanaerobaculia bacterium]